MGNDIDFIHRELRLFGCNGRVLGYAMDGHPPLLERLGLLCIFSTALDQLFEIAVTSAGA